MRLRIAVKGKYISQKKIGHAQCFSLLPSAACLSSRTRCMQQLPWQGLGATTHSPSTIRPIVVGAAVRVLPVLVAGRHARRSTHVSGAHIVTARRLPCSVTGQHWYCSGEPCPHSVRFVCCVSVWQHTHSCGQRLVKAVVWLLAMADRRMGHAMAGQLITGCIGDACTTCMQCTAVRRRRLHAAH
jgi:hypothetical protein